MHLASESWGTQQLAEFMAAVSGCPDAVTTARRALERAAEAFEAELGVIVKDSAVLAVIGFAHGEEPPEGLISLSEWNNHLVELDRIGPCRAGVVSLDELATGRIVLVRAGEDDFSQEELSVLRGMARVLTLTMQMLSTLEVERNLRERSEEQAEQNAHLLESLRDRHRLLETLLTIQRSISHRAPLQEVLDAVCHGAAALMGDEVAGLRLVDGDDPEYMSLVSSVGVENEVLELTRRDRVGSGAGGRAISENRLVVIDSYQDSADRILPVADQNVHAAMAAPVHESGRVVGSLVVASRRPGRTYGESERAMLLAVAEHASLALTDAQAVQAIQQAFNDELTGLPSRALFVDRLEQAVSARGGEDVGVLMLDLDGFRMINESLGHDRGDELLAAVGDRLAACLRETDLVARLGGDEFAILLDRIDRDVAENVAGRIIDGLREPIRLDGRDVFAPASVGIALGGPDVAEPGDLLRNADVAMYRAKTACRGCYVVFEPRMHHEVLERLELEADIRRGWDRHEFNVHYQPIVELDSRSVVAVEALVRWQHPDKGLLLPAQFLQLAEEAGQIVQIGRYVLKEVCRQISLWQCLPGHSNLRICVNLSARELQHPSLVEEVEAAIRSASLDPSCVMLELTEAALMVDVAQSERQLLELKELGVCLAIDDFGRGLSSLSCLTRFPVDAIKIDPLFVAGLHAGREDSALTRAVITLARSLELTSVAEGIEEPGQVEHLRELGCELGQGFLFGRPVDVKGMTELLSTGAAHVDPPASSNGAAADALDASALSG